MPTETISSPTLSLADLLGEAYMAAVCRARAFVSGTELRELVAQATRKVEFYPVSFARRMEELLPSIGKRVCDPLPAGPGGAATRAFAAATRVSTAPLTGLGYLRVGQDGRLYLASKAEHYHLSLGHQFPGYQLIEIATALGIPNCTHNTTRGHVTRLAEERLVAAANGVPARDPDALGRCLSSEAPGVLNRVLNLQTGSLAVEAALKLVLARFHRIESAGDPPPYEGRTPVILVMGDDDGGRAANYHGTTVLTQVLRGMWPEVGRKLEDGGTLAVRPVRINDAEDFRRVLAESDRPPYKAAAFFHEIALMNYGGIRLEPDYLRRCHELCRTHDVPVVADEIQSCAWSPELFLFREYGLMPDAVAVGKGLPGGEYSASRLLLTPALDRLSLFGALVTNGQEELASLAYLVTARFVTDNGAWIRGVGAFYEEALEELVRRYPRLLARREGIRHLSALFFHDGKAATQFAATLNSQGIDISVQNYKRTAPPSCLTKLPITFSPAAVEFLAARMDAALRSL